LAQAGGPTIAKRFRVLGVKLDCACVVAFFKLVAVVIGDASIDQSHGPLGRRDGIAFAEDSGAGGDRA
jgi:hypothetical protein